MEGLVSAIIFSYTDSNLFSSQRAAHDFEFIHVYTNIMSRRLLTGKKLLSVEEKIHALTKTPPPEHDFFLLQGSAESFFFFKIPQPPLLSKVKWSAPQSTHSVEYFYLYIRCKLLITALH